MKTKEAIFAFTMTEDGGSFGEWTEEELREWLADLAENGDEPVFHDTTDDCEQWGHEDVMLVRGSVLTPRPKKVVKDWDI